MDVSGVIVDSGPEDKTNMVRLRGALAGTIGRYAVHKLRRCRMIIGTQTEEKRDSDVLALSATELAYKLGVSLRHIRRMDSSGKLPRPIKLGASVRWPVAEIEQWLAAGAPVRRTWQSLKQEQR